jgi:alpha-ketoglutaric semialdehyde dehydrogenase
MRNTIEIRDPSDQRSVVGEVPAMGAGEVAAAYQRARAGSGGWRSAGPLMRAAVLAKAAVEPTLVSVTPEHALWRDEVFGPVLAVTTARDFDEAVSRANDTAYGLSAAVFTTTLTKANQFIDRSETGQVSVNLPTAGWDVHHPFGGFRESGSAFKEQGAPGLRFYSRIKTAAVRFSWL